VGRLQELGELEKPIEGPVSEADLRRHGRHQQLARLRAGEPQRRLRGLHLVFEGADSLAQFTENLGAPPREPFHRSWRDHPCRQRAPQGLGDLKAIVLGALLRLHDLAGLELVRQSRRCFAFICFDLPILRLADPRPAARAVLLRQKFMFIDFA
jgi:hypothetical protein